MKKALKISAIVIGTLVGLVVVLVVVLPFIIDPNEYKPQIIQAVKEHTGRDLKIDDKIGWTIFPRIGISAGRVQLSNAPGFGTEPFARIEKAGVRVQLLPLLRGRVEIDSVFVDGLTLNLVKNTAGKSNWDDLAGPGKNKPAEKKPAPAEKPSSGDTLGGLVIGGADIHRATVNYRDDTQKAIYSVRDIDLHTGRIASGSPTDIHLALTLQYDTPPKQAKLALQTALTLSNNAVALRNIVLTLDDSRLTGGAEIADLQKLALKFDLALDQIDVDRYLPAANPERRATPATASAQKAVPAPAELPLGMLKTLEANGKLRIGKLKSFGIHSNDITIQLTAHSGVVDVGPNTAKLYGGNYNGHTTLNLAGKTPQLSFSEKLDKIQLGPFLKDAKVFDKFSGEANIALKMTGNGNDAAQIIRTLNGNLSLGVANGAIDGIDISKMENQLKQAREQSGGNLQALVKALPQLKPEKNDQTKFTKLGATAAVTNGIVSNNDLAIEGPHLRVTGSGKIDLVKQVYDNYTLRVGDIPLIISGSLNDIPSIRPDWNAVAKSALKGKEEQKKEELKQKGKEKLRDLLRRR